MKNKNIFVKFLILLLTTGVLLFSAGCSKDKFADINTEPNKIGKGNVPYLLTQAMAEYQPFDYLMWFYDAKYTSHFIQSYTPVGSFGDLFNQMGALGGIGSQFINVRIYEKEIADMISQMSDEEGAQYTTIQCIANVLSISLAINDSDLYGSMPYSETVQLRYGGKLTPKYDTQEELFNTWLEELDNDISTFSGATNQIQVGSNDITYGGDLTKWTKFANGLKLKIAVRLLHQDKSKALEIAQKVGSSDSNIMSGLSDDYIFNRSTDANNGNYTYQTENGYSLGAASKNVIDFMKKNEDPRMLVIFTKNSFNKEVIQAFFDAQANGDERCAVPKYILDNVNYATDANGKKTFVSWKGQGEPWVRYYGIPIGIDLSKDPKYNGDDNYFTTTRWKVTDGDASKTYIPYSKFNEELTRGRCDFTFPTKPKGRTLQDTDDMPWWGMTMSTGEMNLYLAEFKLLGANLPKTAQEYFEAGVRASAHEYNKLAILNKIPYYSEDQCYEGLEDKPVTYGDDEINAMLTHEDYKLTGDQASNLEKVYIQQYLHFYYQPVDQFVTSRRSGIPKAGSTLIPWVNLKASNEIPRRLYSVAPTEEDRMKSQVEAAFAEEGFTFCDGTRPGILNKERVWYDKQAPEFGAGPNY